MRRFASIVIVTAAAFAVGALAGRWYESRRPLPPPPGSFMGEFGPRRSAGGRPPAPPISRADFVAEVERVRPQIEAFRKGLEDIEEQFQRDLDGILTPQQRTLNVERLKRRAEARSAADARRKGEEGLMHLAQVPNMVLLRMVTLQMGYEYLDRDLNFDAAQKEKVFDLLRARRGRMLAFIDGHPPPSVRLMYLAPYAQRLAPPGPPGPPAPPQP